MLNGRGEVIILNRVVRIGLIEKVMFEQNLEGGPCACLIEDNADGGKSHRPSKWGWQWLPCGQNRMSSS